MGLLGFFGWKTKADIERQCIDFHNKETEKTVNSLFPELFEQQLRSTLGKEAKLQFLEESVHRVQQLHDSGILFCVRGNNSTLGQVQSWFCKEEYNTALISVDDSTKFADLIKCADIDNFSVIAYEVTEQTKIDAVSIANECAKLEKYCVLYCPNPVKVVINSESRYVSTANYASTMRQAIYNLLYFYQ